MKTVFHTRSAYLFLPGGNRTPECFLKLDEYFDMKISESAEPSKVLEFPLVGLAGNLCYRMAEIDLYAFLMHDLIHDSYEFWSERSPAHRNIHKKRILASSLLISHFSSCKSLFDAGAIALNQLYSLGLKHKEQDFGKTKFKKILGKKSLSPYDPYFSLAEEIIKWRDCYIHRMPPAVMPVENRLISSDKGFSICLFGKTQKGSDELGGPVNLDEVLVTIENDDSQKKNRLGFCQLLDLHEEWRPRFVEFCTLICDDIERADFLKGCIN